MCLSESSLWYDELFNFSDSRLFTLESFGYAIAKIFKLRLIYEKHASAGQWHQRIHIRLMNQLSTLLLSSF